MVKNIIYYLLLMHFLLAQETQKEFEKELKIQNSAIESLKSEIETTSHELTITDLRLKSPQQQK